MNMAITIIITASFLIQFVTALTTMSIALFSRRKLAWILVTIAFFLMSFRRFTPILFPGLIGPYYRLEMTNEVSGLVLSFLLFIGILMLRPALIEQKTMEEKYRRAHRDLDDIIKFLPDATFVIDRDKKVIAWNKAMEQFTGIKKEMMIGRSDYSLCFYNEKRPILIDIILEPVNEAKKKYSNLEYLGDTVHAEAYVPKAWGNNGAYCWGCASRLLDSEGNLIGAIESVRDVTDRKAAEERLQQNESRVRSIIETAQDGFWVVDNLGIIREVNETYSRMSGYSIEEIVGHAVGDFEVIETPEDTREHIRKVLSSGSDRFETVHRRKDGVRFDVEVSVRQSSRDTQEMFVFLHDITENKRAQQALLESEARVRAKLNAIVTPEGDIGELELEDIIDVPAIQSMMDYFHSITHVGIGIINSKGKVLVGTGWQDICTKYFRVHPETCKNCLESDLNLSLGIESGSYKIYKCKNQMWDIATPIIVGDKLMGNLFLGQFFFQDETPDRDQFRAMALKYGFPEEEFLAALVRVPVWSHELVETAMKFYIRFAMLVSSLGYNNIRLAQTLSRQKAIKEQLRDMNLNLENRITSAVSELREKDQLMILQSRQAAMGEMLGNIAHQWRQPLNVIGISVQNILESERFDKLTREYLEVQVPKIMAQILQMSHTIDDFRNFFRPDKEKSVFHIKTSVVDSFTFVEMSYKDNHVQTVLELDDQVTAFGYPNEFSQVLLNLLNNSLDAIREKKPAQPTVRIRVFPENSRATITITDNAGGIDPKIMHKIFDPYFTTKEMGTGIGLYMAKTIIEKNMGGKLSARNIDDGTEFRIELDGPGRT